MKRPVVFMFSGQGSQYYQMGKELFKGNTVFRHWMLKLDDLVRSMIGSSIIEELYEKRSISESFDCLMFTHPSIFMVEFAMAQTMIEAGIEADYVLGVSMGEYAAAAVSGVISIETALQALMRQVNIFELNCDAGGMLAILKKPQLFDDWPLLHENVELAAVNYASHFVVSGAVQKIDAIIRQLKQQDIIFQRLPVSYAFHSSMIEPCKPDFIKYLGSIAHHRPKIAFVSSTTASTLLSVNIDHFWQVIRRRILFEQTLKAMTRSNEYIYLDLGPSGTLKSFVNNIHAGVKSASYAVMSPFGGELERLNNVVCDIRKKNLSKVSKEQKKMLGFVFTGQGAQFKGMGKGLFEAFETVCAKANEILGYSIETLCLSDPDNLLNQTRYTQPAIYVVNAMLYYNKIQEARREADFLAGHSIGEYNALLAAEVFDFETGLKLVKKRAELMDFAGGGKMAAVIGLKADKIKAVIESEGLHDVAIANYNSPIQTVVAGSKDQIDRAQAFMLKAGAKHYIILNVSGAFHTSRMSTAKLEYKKFVDSFSFAEPVVPVISNLHAKPYRAGETMHTLIEQIDHPVQWVESIQYLVRQGVNEFIEIGAKKILTGLIQQIEQEIDQKGISNVGSRKRIASAESLLPANLITPDTLGSRGFRNEHRLKYAYLTGSMYKGISSEEMVIRMGQAGLMGFFGTGGLTTAEIEKAIQSIKSRLNNGQVFGLNLLHNPNNSALEEYTVDLFIKHQVRRIEASAFMDIRPSLVRYRLKGLRQRSDGKVHTENKIIAKVSRPEIAEIFLSPPPQKIVTSLLAAGHINKLEAEISQYVPMADALCAEADSAGHTDQGVAYALMPAILRLRDTMVAKYKYGKPFWVGAAGGIGTPEAAAAAFILGADFILTGSINQCTVEAATSEEAKNLLQDMNVQDTDYAPAGDMFEWGAKVQVLKRGLFFPARANKLYDIYCRCNSLDDIDEVTRKQIEQKYFKKSFQEVYEEVKQFCPPEVIEKAERNPKNKMALVFRWYFGHCSRLALTGCKADKVDFQIHCGPALGSFNQWVKGTHLENWRNRHVDEIAEKLMIETAKLLNQRFQTMAAREN